MDESGYPSEDRRRPVVVDGDRAQGTFRAAACIQTNTVLADVDRGVRPMSADDLDLAQVRAVVAQEPVADSPQVGRMLPV